MKFNKILAMSLACIMIFGNSFSFAQTPKPTLTVQEAIKKSIQHNTNLMRFEINREILLRSIDQNYRNDQSIFKIFEDTKSTLPAENTPEYEQAKKDMDESFKKAIASSDVVVSKLISQKANIDIAKIVERENVISSIKRLFTSIEQKENDILILSKKIAHDEKTLAILQKQLTLGKISKNKFDEQELELSKNISRLKIEKSTLANYYNELSSLTRIDNIQSKYTLEKLEIPFEMIVLSEEMQSVQNERAKTYSINVANKINETKLSETIYQNYPSVSSESTYNEVKDNKDIAKIDETQAIIDAKKNSQTKYNNLQEIQENIFIAKKDIEKLKIQVKSIEKKYKLGLISKNDYENSSFGLQEAENGLKVLYLQHYQLKLAYENPYLAGQ